MNIKRISQNVCGLLLGASMLASSPAVLAKSTVEKVESWLDKELNPYLVKQFSQHPRFKGKPVFVVSLDNGQLDTDIDQMTRFLRDQISDALISTPGVNLVRRSQATALTHQLGINTKQCMQDQQIQYYLGIDTQEDPLTKKLKITVRALDVNGGGSWVSGFGMNELFKLDNQARESLKTQKTDEQLRGLRALPFDAGEQDLLAQHISNNLGCMLRSEAGQNSKLKVNKGSSAVFKYFDTAFSLIEDFVAQSGLVAVTESNDEATGELKLTALPVNKSEGLYLLSARVTHKAEQVQLNATSTQAYVKLSPQQVAQLEAMPTTPAVQPQATASSTARSSDDGSGLISMFQLVTPVNSDFCASASPWQSGRRVLDDKEFLQSGSCFGVEALTSKPVQTLMFYQGGDGYVQRLHPSACKDLKAPQMLKANQLLRFPNPKGPIPAIGLGGEAGNEAIYLVTISDLALADQFMKESAIYEDACQAAGKKAKGANYYKKGFEAVLKRYHDGNKQAFDWQVRNINHVL